MMLLCQPLQGVATEQYLTKFCDMLGSELDLQMHVRNLWGSLP